jgi:FAD/FMN-containing dehydrogenase
LNSVPNLRSSVSLQDRNSLAAAVTGPVLLPGDDGFGEEVSAFNLAVVHQPAVAVGAASAADVQAAVRFAAAHQLAVAVSSTGHGPAMAATKDALMITTRRMTNVTIDPAAKTARVEAGW